MIDNIQAHLIVEINKTVNKIVQEEDLTSFSFEQIGQLQNITELVYLYFNIRIPK